MRHQKLNALGIAAIAVLGIVGVAAAAPEASVTLTKTVGTSPFQCATTQFLAEVPADQTVYYCYKMTYNGTITASSHTLVDSVLGDVLHGIPGGKCCTDQSGNNCADPTDICIVSSNSCFNAPYTTCVPTTYPGVCCSNLFNEENKCNVPHTPCEEDTNCGIDQRCVIEPIVGPGKTVTRVITATVPAGGIANTATWSAETGICCDNTSATCRGTSTPPFCDSTSDCPGGESCRKSGIGLCCMPSDHTSCDRVCLEGRECPAPFDDCVAQDTSASGFAAASVALFGEAPTLSTAGMALVILLLIGVAFGRLRERESRQN